MMRTVPSTPYSGVSDATKKQRLRREEMDEGGSLFKTSEQISRHFPLAGRRFPSTARFCPVMMSPDQESGILEPHQGFSDKNLENAEKTTEKMGR